MLEVWVAAGPTGAAWARGGGSCWSPTYLLRERPLKESTLQSPEVETGVAGMPSVLTRPPTAHALVLCRRWKRFFYISLTVS